MEIREYNPANWFTESGLWKKRNLIQAKGLPNVTNWRFITLTLDPAQFANEVEAYFAGKEKVRRFLFKLREMLGREVAGCWKLEFQENGYAHWHLILDYKRSLP